MTSVDELTYADNAANWPAAPGNGSLFYLTDEHVSNDDGRNWAVSRNGTDGAYMAVAAAGNTGNDIGSPGFGPATSLTEFVRVEPFGSLVYSSNSTGAIAAGQSIEFSMYLEGGQTLSGLLDVDVSEATVSIDLVGIAGTVIGGAGQSFVSVPLSSVISSSTYTVRITSDTAANYNLSLYRNAVLEVPDSGNGSELSIGGTLLGSATVGRWAAIGTIDPTAGDPFDAVHTNNPGQFIDISGTGTFINVRDERWVNFISTVSNEFFPAGTYSVSDNGVLAYGSGKHGRFIIGRCLIVDFRQH